MKKLIAAMLVLFIFTACEKEDSSTVTVSFVLKNDLVWNIGYDYKVSGTDPDGNYFESQEIYTQYVSALLDVREIKGGSTLTLYKGGNPIWTSDPIKKSCSFTYTDKPSPIEDVITVY